MASLWSGLGAYTQFHTHTNTHTQRTLLIFIQQSPPSELKKFGSHFEIEALNRLKQCKIFFTIPPLVVGYGAAGSSVDYGIWKQRQDIRFQKSGDGGQVEQQKRYLMTPLLPTSASELLTSSTSVPVGASSVMVVWKAEAVKIGVLSLTSLTRTVTVHVPLREGTPGNKEIKQPWVSPLFYW